MEREYINLLRVLFYSGVVILSLNNLPGIRTYVDPFLQYSLLKGITVNLVLSAAVIVGAYYGFKRKFG